ncbi:MAG: DUF2505 domain-containing protein [Jatrophihabitantaceae bacterium]
MRIERTMHNALPAEEVYAMSCSKVFQERKCRDAGALSYDVRVVEDGAATIVTTKRTLPTVGFPSLLRRFVPAGVTSTETIAWGPAAADGSRSAVLSVDFHGAPASLKGTITLRPDGAEAAVIVIDALFRAHVPLLAGKVEKFAAPIILGVIDAEEQTGKAWAAGVR